MLTACAPRLLPAPSTSSSWALRTGPLGEAPSLASCAKVRCLRSDDDGVKSREASSSNGLDDVRTSVGRRGVLNLALGLGSALLVGRWADNGSAAAAAALPIKDTKSPFDEKRLLDQNRRMQKVNNAPEDFPNFIREGFEVKVITDAKYTTAQSGLIFYDLVEGHGEEPKDGQQVKFHYIGYNENGRRIDSSYQQGEPARTRVGIKGMIPGFEEGIRTMKPGGKRRIVIPPELGPPVGPSTFFSAKQFEVFDVELLEVKDCVRRTVFLYSDVVCD